MKRILGMFMAVLMVSAVALGAAPSMTLLNVSYDPTRELYAECNRAFANLWEERTGEKVVIRQSHGGSGKQARSVIDGLEADIVTLALAYDIDAIAQRKLITPGWQKRLPYNSTPYTSTIVFMVRQGNPKGIRDWEDLVKPGVKVIPANPSTSGGARWTYLAAYGASLKRNGGDAAKARAYVAKFYRNAPVLDAGARGATTTFLQRKIGDVLVGWESEALMALHDLGKGGYEIVYPSISIVAEPPVALVDAVVDKRGTRKLAEEYLNFLFTDAAQEIAARHYYRPRSEAVAKKHEALFPPVPTFTIDEVFGGWSRAQKAHFGEGGVFDSIFKASR